MKEYCLLLCMIISIGALGQSGEKDHIVYLKDSRFLEGEVIEEEYGTHLKLRTDKNEIITVPTYHVRRIKKKMPNTIVLENGKTLRTKGYYNYTTYSNSFGLSKTADYLLPGIHFHIINGYQFKPTFATGLGIGIDYYGTDDLSINLIPIYADFRGFFFTKKISPYYGMGLGYGFGYRGDQNIVWAKGGVFLRPEIGLKFATRRITNLTIGLAYRFQQFNAGRLRGDILEINTGSLRRTDFVVGLWW